MSSTADGGDALTAREQRRLEREERKRRRAAQESSKQSSASTEKKTPGKDDKRTKRDFSSSNGSVSKKPPSGTKRTGMTSYEKVNIIEKTAKFDSVEKENKGKPKTEAPSKSDPSSRRKLGSKFFDNLSKFESQAKQNEDSKKFVRSYSTRPSHPSSTTSSTADPSFRRSYRPSRSTPVVDDPSVLTRRSLRKERVLESIAKLERKSSVDDGTTLRQKPSSPLLEKPEDKSKSLSRRSSASSTKTSHSDSGSSTTSSTKGLTRAQQALERHKERMRKTPAKPASPPGKIRSNESRKTPGKTPKSRSKEKESPPTTPSAEPRTRKISVTTTPVEGDIVEVTTVTEVMTPAEGKMNVIVKEIAFSEEESEKLVSPVDSVEYQLGDPRPISVEDTVTKFTEPETPIEPVKTSTEEKPKRSRRKLPSIPSQEQDVIVIETSPTLAPAEEPIAETKPRHTSTNKTEPEGGSGEPILTPGKQDVAREMAPAGLPAAESASEAKPRRRSKKKNRSEDGSGESALTVETHNVVVVETSPTFTPPEEATSEKKTRRHSKKNRPGVGSKEPIFKEENQDAVKKTSPIFSPVEVPHTEKKTQHHYSKKNKPEDGTTEPVLTLEEQSVVVIETSPTFQENMDIPRSANAHSPPSDQNFQFTYNFNENSNLEQKSSMRDQMAFIRDQDLDNEQEAVKRGMDLIKHDKMIDDITVKKVTVPEMTTNKEMSGSKTYNPDEAIEVLRRLSQEVHSQPPVTERSSVTKSSIVTSQAIEEKNSQDQSKPKSDSTSQRRRDFSEKRPASLHIEEVLYISEEDDHPRSLSPQKRTFEEITRTPSPIKFRKSSIETFSRKSPTPEAPRRPSPQKSPAKLTPKSAADPPETLIFEYTAEVTPLVQRSRTPSPLKSPRSLPKTPDSPRKSPVRAPTPKSPPAKSPAPVSSPTKVPTSIPSPRSQSPVRSPQKVQESFQIVTDSAIKSADSTPKNRTPSPQREVAKSPTRVRTPSPVKRIESPSKEPEPKITSPPKSPEPQVRSSSPRLQKSREAPARSLSPVRTAATEKKSSKKKMLATRRNFAPRYKKSWLDESDDDNISLLSDAPSDASSIDMDWLGHDSSDDEDYVRKKSSLDKPSSVSVQRSSSSAQDMLKMWEKKVTQPDRGARSSPTKLPSDSVKRVGSVRAAWDSKRNSALQDSSYESISDAQERSNGHSENGSESPTTPSHGRLGSKLSPEDCGSLKSPSGSDWKSKASEEEKEIFDDKMAGKIQGAKALFENLTSSPKKSPSLVRSPRRKIIDKPPQQESAENSPELSRRSSTTDNIVTSRKSSISLASESSDAVMQNESSEDSLKVDNMRAMFESQANKKTEARRHKTSLAEMVADDDSDITDVRSIKAMWESMDNHSSTKEDKKSKTPKSTIQKRAAARKKKGRRSMTQPVTSEDAVKARDMMNGKSKVQSDTDEEEETLNFVDRLKFFNQLAKHTNNRPRARRRSDSHPAKASANEVGQSAEIEHSKPTPARSPIKSPIRKLAPVDTSSQQSKLTPQNQSSAVQRLSRKFSSSSDNESLLSSSSTSIDDLEPGRKKLFLSSGEDSSDMSVHVAEIKTTGSIHERLKKLQRTQADEKWKKQNRNSEIKSSVGDRLNKLKSQDEKWKKPPPSVPSDFAARAERLSERIAKMTEDSKAWAEKAGKQNDAAQFTIQAKLAKRDGIKAVAVLPSPVMKRRVLPVVIPNRETSISESDVKKEDDSTSMNQLSFVEKLANKGLDENVIKKTEVLTTEVPSFDHEEFDKFFGVTTTSDEVVTNGYSEIELDIEDFSDVETSTRLSDIGRFKAGIKQPNKRGSSKRNPLKVLAARTDLKQSYDTERSNIATLEQQRIAVQRGHGANFTSAALAGLAAKADLKKVSLRSTKNTPMPSNDDLKPFKDVMLLRAKGRRQVQTRLVEPCPASLCSDDAYLLVTPNKLFGWFGEYCNVIERAKINEIADFIVIKGDLGSKVSALKTIEENVNPDIHKDFWKLLGGLGEWDRTTSPGGDEQYEVDVETTIKTYKMIDSKLVPYEDAWGKFPKMGMLGSSDTFVFDFGAEMYIWQGKEVSFADRRLAVRLARVLWEQEYDYTEHGFSPFHAKELKGKRPEYGLFARVNENLETSLFQEKFIDWSNIYREVGQDEASLRETSRGKAVEENENKAAIASEMEACDVVKMREEATSHSSLIIEGHDVALGDGDIIDEDGRVLEIVTSDVEHYYITENKIEKLSDFVLHRENSYVIKWSYSISSTGRFEKSKGGKSVPAENGNNGNGRQRVAFFSWTGPDSAMTDKGASAFIATNMDTDEGPVINLHESTAPVVFNKCFHGNMAIMNGKRGVKRGGFNWKLFKVKGHSSGSAALEEVPCECKSLRSGSSFVTMMPRDATAIVWHGCRSPKNVREAAEEAIKKMSERMPESIPFRRNKKSIEISVCDEGEESDKFWEGVGIKRRNRYECLIDVDTPTLVTRAWKFDIQSDVFVADELHPVEHNTLFPLVQEQLTDIEKPSMVLVDSTHGTLLWQNCDSEALTGSAKRRWDVLRRLSMETAIKYCKEHGREEAIMVEAGTEPISLTNAFPSWVSKDKATIDKLLPQKHKPVSEVLSTLTRLTYTMEELKAKDLPDGVDASHLESYLSNTDFEKLFEMTKKEFYKLPVWKQKKIRQEKNFF